jgi:hypothetical protein
MRLTPVRPCSDVTGTCATAANMLVLLLLLLRNISCKLLSEQLHPS